MKLLVVSDEESEYIWNYFDPAAFQGVEVILSCGDLQARYLEFLVSMIPAPLFYVPGNHDKSYQKQPPEGTEDIDCKLITYKGLRILGIGGCKSSRDALHEYTEEAQQRRVRKLNKAIRRAGGFDILLTHTAAEGLGDGDDQFHKGFAVYRDLLERYQPQYHLFGHQHKRYAARATGPALHGKTQLVNACGYRILEYRNDFPAQD